MNPLRQTFVAILLAVRSAPRRLFSTAATILAVATLIVVLLGFLSMREGYRSALVGAGDPALGIVLRTDAKSAQASSLSKDQLTGLIVAPGIERDAEGRAKISPELTVAAALPLRAEKRSANLNIRGISPESGFLLRNITLIAGRAPLAGANELLVGRAAAGEFAGLEVGRDLHMAGSEWKVVGIFTAGGSVYESEARADLHLVQTLFKRGTAVQSARVTLRSSSELATLQKFLKAKPEMDMSVQAEPTYFASLSEKSGNFIQRLGWPLALLMAIGALAGAGNTMYSSIEARNGEIVTMRSLGFSRASIFAGVIGESVALALIGSMIGLIVAWVLFEGLKASTIGSSLGQVIFEYHLSLSLILQAMALALIVGVAGALAPALAATRIPLAMVGRD